VRGLARQQTSGWWMIYFVIHGDAVLIDLFVVDGDIDSAGA